MTRNQLARYILDIFGAALPSPPDCTGYRVSGGNGVAYLGEVSMLDAQDAAALKKDEIYAQQRAEFDRLAGLIRQRQNTRT